jgi:exodeoxyribonuclease V gamma subunit
MTLQASFSNRLEALFDALCERLDAAPRDPFTRDTLIVPSAAVQRWLLLRLAERRGIAANLDMVFLAPWLHGLLREEQDPEPLGAAWPWRVYELLGHPKLLREQPRLAHSLGEPGAPGFEALRWERALAVAGQLERLGLERPDWLAAWRERRFVTDEPDEAWLAALWRALADEAGDLLARRLERIGERPLERAVHLFAPPRIAPLHWQALQRLDGELCLYQLNPCREYWFDLVSPRRLARLRERGLADAHEVGHPLLALNAQGIQQQLLQLAEAGHHGDEGDYREPAGDSLLARVQRGLLDLDGAAPEPAAAGDRSLELHRCHSLSRELEVLHDRLLGLVAFDPRLQLSDIHVLCPDLERAAPLIEAVFGSMPAERALPFAISGQAEPPLPAPLRRVLVVLELIDSPATQAQLAGLLALLQPDEAVDALLAALQAAGHHAGLDAGHASRHGLSQAHTLDAAVQRLLLAYCLPEPATLLTPLGPWRAAPQTLSQELLATLQALSQGLSEAAAASAAPQPPIFWAGWLRGQAERWLPPSPDQDSEVAESGAQLRDAITRLEQAWLRAGLRSPLPLGRVRAALLDALHDPVRGGVAGGAISFSNLASLAPLPARVIAVIGLDDKAWPRPATPDPTDLLAKQPRPGDRRPRAEQRELLLQALLNASDVLHLSYSGRSQRDGSALPPSVMLAELLEWLGEAGRGIVVEQPLQPFSPLAFDAGRPRQHSFRTELLPPAAGTAALDLPADEDEDEEQDAQPEPPFLPSSPLPPLPPPESCTLEELQRALEHPARAWLRRRLGLNLPWDEEPWLDAEPFGLDPRRLRDWVDEFGEQLPVDPAAWARSDPRWPLAALGEAQLQAEAQPLRRYAERLARWRAAPLRAPSTGELVLQLQGSALSLRLDGLALRDFEGRPSLLRPRYDKPRPADWLAVWLRQLVLNALLGPEARAIGLQRGGDSLGFRSPEQPLQLLQGLAELAFADPPPLLPLRTAWELLENGETAARKRWIGDRFAGERADAHWQLLLRGRAVDPLEGLEPLAQQLLGPLLDHREATP